MSVSMWQKTRGGTNSTWRRQGISTAWGIWPTGKTTRRLSRMRKRGTISKLHKTNLFFFCYNNNKILIQMTKKLNTVMRISVNIYEMEGLLPWNLTRQFWYLHSYIKRVYNDRFPKKRLFWSSIWYSSIEKVENEDPWALAFDETEESEG